MKPQNNRFLQCSIISGARIFAAAACSVIALSQSTQAATRTWTGTTDTTWNTIANWGGSAAPTSADTVWFDTPSTANLATVLDANYSISGLKIGSPSGAVSIGSNILTIGAGGIDMSAATQDLTISSGLTLLGNTSQTWNVGSGRTLTLNTGTFTRSAGATLNIQGAGTVVGTNFAANVNGIVGPWASVGSGTSMSYATKNGSNQIVAYTGATAYSTGSNSTTGNFDAAAGSYALNGTRNANTIRETGGAVTITSSGGARTNAYNGLMNAGTGTFTITSSININIGSTNELVVTTNTQNFSINGVIANNGANASALTFNSGGGTLTLSNANTYTGGTNINSGTLAITNATNTLADSGAVNVNGGTLSIAGNSDTVGAVTLNSGSITGTTGVLTGSSYSVLSGTTSAILGGSGIALTKTGAGTVTLGGANTYTGATTISNGTLAVIGSLASGSAVAVNAGGILAGTNTSGGSSTVAGTVTVAGGTSASTQGTISLVNGSMGTLNLGALTLGGTSGNFSQLNLEGNATTADLLALGSNALTVNAGGVQITMTNLGSTITSGETLNLLTFGSGTGAGFATGSGTTVGALTLTNPILSFGVSGSLTVTSTAVQLVTSGASAPTTAYWKGDKGTTWAANDGTNGNFTTDQAGTSHVGAYPGSGSDLIFAATGATNLTNTLGQDFSVKSLTFDATTGAANISGSNTLTVGTGGITLESGNGGATLGMATLALGSAQVWTNHSANTLTVSSGVSNGANTLTVDGSGTTTISGVIGSGAGGLLKNGDGTLTLSNANTFTGGATISTGILQLSGAGTLGSTGGTLTVNGGTIDLNGTAQTVGSLTGTGGTILNNSTGTNVTFTIGGGNGTGGSYQGVIANNSSGTGTVALTKTGSGTITLSGANTYSGGTNINGGILSLDSSDALGTTGTIGFGGGTLQFGASNTTDYSSRFSTASQAMSIDTNSQSVTFATGLMGSTSGSLTKTGAGTLTLSAANTYTGNTTVSAGVLTLTNALGTSGTYSGSIGIGVGGTLNINSATVYASQMYNNNNNGTGSNIYITGSSAVTLSGALSVNNNGSQQAMLSLAGGTLAANSVSITRGGQNYGGGVLAGSASEGIYVNGGALSDATTLNIVGSNSSATLRLDSGSVTVGGTTTINTTANNRMGLLDVNGGTFTSNDTTGAGIQIGGTGTNYGELLVRGTGVLNTKTITMGAAGQTIGIELINAIGGTTYIGSGGIVALGSIIPTINLGSATVATAPVIAASADWSSSLAMTLTNSSSALATTFQAADSGGTAHNITLSGYLSGGGGLTKTGAGTLTLNGTGNAYTGVTTINGGTLNINSQWALGGAVYTGLTFGATGGTLQYAATLLNGTTDITFNGTARNVTLTGNATIDTNGNNISYASTFGNSGAGGLTKAGGGTLTLTDTTYTGATTVNGGTLKVTGSNAGSAVTVNNTATLASGASGNVVGSSVTVQSGGTLAAGGVNTIGTATVGAAGAGATTLNSGSIFSWDLDASGAGTSYDKAVTSGLSGGSAVFTVVLGSGQNFTDSFWNTTHTWSNIFSTDGTAGGALNLASIFSTFDGTNVNTDGTVTGASGHFGFTGGSSLTWTAVPEPTSALAGLLLGAGLLRRRRSA